MKSVLISIQPKWCELIANGKKTIEVRKTRPKQDTPFKCYIYQTKAKDRLIMILKDGDEIYGETYHGKPVFIKTYGDGYWTGRNQKIIGEFLCFGIDAVFQCNSGYISEYGCISQSEFFDYLGIPQGTHLGYDKHAYAWHISDLVIYDKPKELSEFGLKRPPQSWCYVKEVAS